MGDTMTEMVRRENNYERFKNYLRKILDYLLNPNEDNFELVIAAAMNCDKSFLRGYWKERFDISVEENIRKSFKKILKELAEKNKIQWAKLLTQAMIVGGEEFREIKSISPFADMILLPIFYGYGFATIQAADLQRFLTELTENKNFKTNGSGNTYFISIPKSVDGSEVFSIDKI